MSTPQHPVPTEEDWFCISVSAGAVRFRGSRQAAEEHLELLRSTIERTLRELGISYMQKETMLRRNGKDEVVSDNGGSQSSANDHDARSESS